MIKITDYFKGNTRTVKVKKNIVGSFFVKGFSIIVSLILVPLTIGYVSSELYGIWLTLATIISWASLFDLGFGNGLKNKVAACVALGDWEKAQRYVSTAYAYFSLIFIPLSIIIYFVCPLFDWCSILNIDIKYKELLIAVMRIVIVFFSLSMIIRIQSTILQALQMNAISAAFEALGQFLVLIVTYILTITTKPSLVYLAYAISASPLVIYLVGSLWLYGYKFKQLCPSMKLIDGTLVKDILNLGLKFFVIQVAFLVLFQTINIIISNVSGPEAVTEYNVVYKYISVPLLATTIIIAPFWSAFTDAFTMKDYEWMRRAYLKLIRLFVFAILVVLLLVLLYPVAFRIWLGDKVSTNYYMVITVAIYVIVMIWNNIHAALINGTGIIKISVIISVFSAVINIPLALWLGHIYGVIGVIASVVSINLISSIFSYIQINKIIKGTAKGIWMK